MKVLRIVLFLFCTVSLPGLLLKAQSLQSVNNYIHYSTDQNLPSNIVHDILADSMGILWMATEQGVVRFNGQYFQYFDQSNGLSDNDVLRLIPAANDELWIATNNGLPAYIKKHQTQNSKTDKQLSLYNLEESYNYTVFRDSFKNIWISNKKTGLSKIDSSGNFQTTFYSPGINYIFEYNREIYGLRETQGLVKIEPNELSLETIIDFNVSSQVKSHLVGKQLLSTDINNRICEIDLDKMSLNYIETDIQKDEELIIYAVKKFDNRYLVCSSEGLYIKGRDINLHLLNDQLITSAAKDKEGGIWLSSLNNGVFYFPFLTSKTNYIEGIKDSQIDFMSRNDSSIVIGNESHIFYSKENQDWVSKRVGLNYPINSVIKESDHTIFLGDVFLGEIKKEQLNIYGYSGKQGLIQSDNIIMATFANTMAIPLDSLYLFGDSIILNNKKAYESLIDKWNILNVKTKCLDRQGELIALGTVNGLYFLKNGKISKASREIPALKDEINCLEFQNDSLLWIGTENFGVLNYDLKNNLTSNLKSPESHFKTKVNDILFDITSKYLIVARSNGIDFYKDSYLASLSKDNGLPSSEVRGLAIENENLLALSANGLMSISLHEIEKLFKRPELKILWVENEDEKFYSEPLSFSNDQNSLKILTEAIAYNRKVNIEYRLNGNEWLRTNAQAIILNNLATGSYLIEVRAGTMGENYSDVKSLKIQILPPFWLNKWFLVAISIVVLLLIYAFFKFKILEYNKQVLHRLVSQTYHRLLRKKKIELKNSLDGTKNLIELDDILRIEGAKEYIKVYYKDRSILVKESMREIIKQLNDIEGRRAFVQIHKSHIIHIDKIEAYNYQFLHIQGENLPIGRHFREQLKPLLEKN